MPTKNSDLSQTQASKVRAKPGQYVKDLYNQAIVERIFEDGSIPSSKLAGSVGGLFDSVTMTNVAESAGSLTIGFQLKLENVALTEKCAFFATAYPDAGDINIQEILPGSGDIFGLTSFFVITNATGYGEVTVTTGSIQIVPITIDVVLPNGSIITNTSFSIPPVPEP